MKRTIRYAPFAVSIVWALFTLACGNDAPAPAPAVAPAPVAPAVPAAQPAMPAQPAVPVQPAQPSAQIVPTAPSAGDFIATNMTARQQQFAQGLIAATPIFRGTLAQGATQDFQAVLQAGKCFKIIGIGGPTVTDLDLKLFDPAGAEIASDTATDNYPVLGVSNPVCPSTGGAYRMQVVMYQGNGEFGVQVFQTQ